MSLLMTSYGDDISIEERARRAITWDHVCSLQGLIWGKSESGNLRAKSHSLYFMSRKCANAMRMASCDPGCRSEHDPHVILWDVMSREASAGIGYEEVHRGSDSNHIWEHSKEWFNEVGEALFNLPRSQLPARVHSESMLEAWVVQWRLENSV